MDQDTLSELQKARDLLRAGKIDEARPILARAVQRDPNVESAWYMLSFTLDEPQRQRYALEQVLRINPGNQKAQARLAALSETEAQAPGPAPVERQAREARPVPETPASVRKPVDPRAKPKRRRLSKGVLVLALTSVCAVLVVGAGLAYLLFGGGGLLAGAQPATQPAAAQAPVEPIPTPLPTATPTLPPSPTPTWTPTPTQRVYEPEFASAPCNFVVPEGVTVECGFVSVPEKRGEWPTNTVRLAVAVYRSTSDQPAPDPVMFLQGGPGGSAVQPLSAIYEGYIAPILEERDLIVFDQRGTGLSDPSLECPELDVVSRQDLKQGIPDDERVALYSEAFQACHDRLAYMGVKLDAYTSAASAADVRDILAALDYQQVNLYGGSYGTRLALTVLRDYPEIVRSAVLDSALPLEVKLFNEATAKADYALGALFANCAADPVCDAVYPDLETVFYDLVRALNAKPIYVQAFDLISKSNFTVEVDGTTFIGAVHWGLYISEFIPLMPLAIYEIHRGDHEYLSALLSASTAPYRDVSLGAFASINCHEQVFATTPEELESDLAAFPDLEAYGRMAVYGDADNLFAICEAWGAAPYDPGEGEPLVSDIPALIIAGEYDPATPPYFAEKLVENLSNSYLVHIPGMGHVPSMGETAGCPLEIALAFLHDPRLPPEPSCIEEMNGAEFVIQPGGAP